MFSRCNGMSCKTLRSRIIALFLKIFAIFKFLTFLVIIYVFGASRVKKPPLAFDKKLLECFCWSWINFQLFNITNFSNFLISQVIARPATFLSLSLFGVV